MALSPMAHTHMTSNDPFRSNIFQPPQLTPASATPPITSRNDYFSNQSRKRQRADSSMGKSTYSSHDWPCGIRSGEEDTSLSTESLHINDRYKLKGGFDTPGLVATGELDSPIHSDINARRTMNDPAPRLHISDPSFGGPLARERNGFARRSAAYDGESNTSPSWTRLALTLPFSIAGKMFSFGTTVLKGFYAGGGQGFEMGGSSGRGQRFQACDSNRWQHSLATPVPGSWHESPPQQDHPFMGDFEQDNTPESTRPPPTKRRLTDKDTWVMVGTPDFEGAPTPLSPKRKPISINSTPKRPGNLRTTSRRTASRRQSYITSQGSPATLHQQVGEQLPRLSMPALSPTCRGSGTPTYHSPDAERFARRQAKQERAADKTMNSMSRQLEELIRQGQAALGTKFTVEDNGFDDEGFVDEY